MKDPDVDRLQSALADSEASAERYKTYISELEERQKTLLKEVDGLEEAVARLEAEGLQPLVDRLRSQIGSIKKLVQAMATAIDEITEGGSAKETSEAIEDIEDALKTETDKPET